MKTAFNDKYGPEDRELAALLKRAESCAATIIKDNLGHKSPRDIAIEAWIWNEERNISHDFTPIRARWLAIEHIRTELGRVDKKRFKPKPKTYGSAKLEALCPSYSASKEHPLDLDLIKDQKFRTICDCLILGMTKAEIAALLKVSPTRISQIIGEHAEIFGHFVPKEKRAPRYAAMTANWQAKKANRKKEYALRKQGSAAVHVLPDA